MQKKSTKIQLWELWKSSSASSGSRLLFRRWKGRYIFGSYYLMSKDNKSLRIFSPKGPPQESTAQQLLFEWSYFRISSTGSKVRTTLYSIINSSTGKYCSAAFIWMVTLKDFIHRLKRWNQLVQHNKQYQKKVLLNSSYLNGHTLGFHPQTLKLEPRCSIRGQKAFLHVLVFLIRSLRALHGWNAVEEEEGNQCLCFRERKSIWRKNTWSLVHRGAWYSCW